MRAGQLALTVLVTWFVADRLGFGLQDLAELGPQWWTPNPLLLAASCGVLLIGNLLSGVIWGRMVHDLGGPKLPYGTSIRLFLVANLGRYLPGKIWQVAGLAILAKRRGVAASTATGAAILGHALSLGAATLVGGVVFVGIPLGVGLDGWVVVAATGALLVVALLPPVFGRLISLATRWGVTDIGAARPGSRHAVVWLALLIANWLVYAAAFTILARSFEVTGPGLAIGPAFVGAYVLGYVAVFAPAGIGVREVALTGLLSPAVGAPAAVGLAVVARVWTTAVEVLPGALLWGREASLAVPQNHQRQSVT